MGLPQDGEFAIFNLQIRGGCHIIATKLCEPVNDSPNLCDHG